MHGITHNKSIKSIFFIIQHEQYFLFIFVYCVRTPKNNMAKTKWLEKKSHIALGGIHYIILSLKNKAMIKIFFLEIFPKFFSTN